MSDTGWVRDGHEIHVERYEEEDGEVVTEAWVACPYEHEHDREKTNWVHAGMAPNGDRYECQRWCSCIGNDRLFGANMPDPSCEWCGGSGGGGGCLVWEEFAMATDEFVYKDFKTGAVDQDSRWEIVKGFRVNGGTPVAWRFRGWTDYWGEYDSEFEVRPA